MQLTGKRSGERDPRRRRQSSHRTHLVGDLVGGAEDVRVVLLEPADAGEARERAAQLVAVQHAKVSVA